MRSTSIFTVLAFLALGPAAGAGQDLQAPLPPPLPWSGQTRDLVVAANDPWITPAEASSFRDTPAYDETVAWLRKLVDASPQLEMTSIGNSDEGRQIWMVIASRAPSSDPATLRGDGKPILFAHAGIHAGEIDGKDAGLMLLRDMTVRGTRADLLDLAHFLFVPILNVDGHERSSAYSRMNQRGPHEKGWRTNRRNLNLNRDFTKLETPGARAVVEVIESFQPDMYLDLHVTDGVDYQYDVTYGYNGPHGWSPRIAGWLDQVYRPYVDGWLSRRGHVPGPLIFGANEMDMYGGMYAWTASPRFSNGYGDARHLPTVLLENHSLKPYEQRVLGTHVFLEATLRVLAEHHQTLRAATLGDRQEHPSTIPLDWQVGGGGNFQTMDFLGVKALTGLSPITGGPVSRWTGELETIQIPVIAADSPRVIVQRPREYIIPAAWADIAERLRLHGIQTERVDEPFTRAVRMYRLPDAAIEVDNTPFEGRARVTSGEPVVEETSRDFAPGAHVVRTAQPLGELAVLLLEPQSPDSYFQWGYLLEILQATEYFETYAMEPLAQRMLDADPELKSAFEQRLQSDREFAGNARARLDFFYERTPYYDSEYKLYPIARSLD